MDIEARREISQTLGLKPLRLDPANVMNMSRPRFFWTDLPPISMEGITHVPQDDYIEIRASAKLVTPDSWLRPGWSRTSQEPLPTFMRCLPRNTPADHPAGLNRCDTFTLQRWKHYDFCYPPYQFKADYLIIRADDWRVTEASERELLMGFGASHTEPAMAASKAKQNWDAYEVERLSLLGDSFAMASALIFAVWGTNVYVKPKPYQHYVARLGLAPGLSLHPSHTAPLSQFPAFGASSSRSRVSLASLFAARCNHTGCDVRISTGQLINPKAYPRQSIDPNSWAWKVVFRHSWKQKAHINELELRMIVLSVEWMLRRPATCRRRLLHLTDSYVSMSVISKGRSSSRALNRVLRRLAAALLAARLFLLVGHVDSMVNPTDAASRH